VTEPPARTEPPAGSPPASALGADRTGPSAPCHAGRAKASGRALAAAVLPPAGTLGADRAAGSAGPCSA